MTFEQRLKEGQGQSWVDVGGMRDPGRGKCKGQKGEHTRTARTPVHVSKGESSRRGIGERAGDHIMRALQVGVRTLVFTLK